MRYSLEALLLITVFLRQQRSETFKGKYLGRWIIFGCRMGLLQPLPDFAGSLPNESSLDSVMLQVVIVCLSMTLKLNSKEKSRGEEGGGVNSHILHTRTQLNQCSTWPLTHTYNTHLLPQLSPAAWRLVYLRQTHGDGKSLFFPFYRIRATEDSRTSVSKLDLARR